MTDQTLWWIAIGAGVLVTAVVALLLYLIVVSARRIEARLAVIWGQGQRVANNTIHIPLLGRIAHNLADASSVFEAAVLEPGGARAHPGTEGRT